MRNRFRILILIIVWSLFGIWNFPAGAMGGPAPRGQRIGWMIENFEDRNINYNPEWWVFDLLTPEVVSTADLKEGDASLLVDVGLSALKLSGVTKTDWYVGGMGCYLARHGQNLMLYRNFQADVYGFGPGNGTLKIELFDDDNNTWVVEQNTLEAYAPLFDDRFAYETRVDWTGWRRIVVPLAEFLDDNPGVGDDLWNPEQIGQSGGLLQMQLISIASSKVGSIRYIVDNIKLTK